MHVFKSILSLVWRGWFVLVGVISTLVFGAFLIFPLTFREKDFPQAYQLLRVWAKVVLYGSGIWYQKHGFQNFDSHHPYVVVANHTSMMDIMLMFILHPKPMVFVGKKELNRLPVFGYIFNKLHIAVDRDDPNSRMKVFRAAGRKLKEGKSVCIFPEGGVPDRSVFMDEFMDGPFAIAVMNKVPLITLTICGMKRLLPYAYFIGRPGKAHVFLSDVTTTRTLEKKDIPLLRENAYQKIYQQLQDCYSQNFHG